MDYTNEQILSGLLILLCIILLYCWFTKKSKNSNYEGLNRPIPGLHFKDGMSKRPIPGLHYKQGFYVQEKRDLGILPDGTEGMYVTGGKTFGHSGYSDVEGLESAPVTSLSQLEASPSPAADTTGLQVVGTTNIGWQCDGSIPDYYTRDGCTEPISGETYSDDEVAIINNTMSRTTGSVKAVGSGSLTGSILGLTDWSPAVIPTRDVTM